MAEETGLALKTCSNFVRRCSRSECEHGACLRVVSIERGYDPREFALVAFGVRESAACELADAMAIPTVVIPARPGALSAFGILVSDVVKDYSRTLLWRFADRLPQAKLQKEFRKLEAGGAEGISRGTVARRSSV